MVDEDGQSCERAGDEHRGPESEPSQQPHQDAAHDGEGGPHRGPEQNGARVVDGQTLVEVFVQSDGLLAVPHGVQQVEREEELERARHAAHEHVQGGRGAGVVAHVQQVAALEPGRGRLEQPASAVPVRRDARGQWSGRHR